MDSPVLVIVNVGSSTIKLAAFRDDVRLASDIVSASCDSTVVDAFLSKLPTPPAAVGHRIVHGGGRFVAPVRIGPAELTELESLIPLDELHMRPSVGLVRTLCERRPTLVNVACFDTAFHHTLPPLEQRFGIPQKWHEAGVRRYGFHGLSYESIVEQLPTVSPVATAGRTVDCHLGSGSSLCGLIAGRSVTTTMGFSPLDGLLMATRCGRIDPAAVLHLVREHAGDVDAVAHLLERESGLLGVSGVSADMRGLLAHTSPEARFAVELFVHCVVKEIAAAGAVLGGLDAIVFTGGIGEHAADVRQRVCDAIGWLGVSADPVKNRAHATAFHTSAGRVELFILPADEERVIARSVVRTLNESPS